MSFRCRCDQKLNRKEYHRALCSIVGILSKLTISLEIVMTRVCREAGTRVQTNVFLRDLDITVPVTDNRRIEVIANGTPLNGGVQIAIDTTMISILRGDGRPRPRATERRAVAIADAEKSKRVRYPELDGGGRCKLILFAIEVHGR